MCCRRDADWHWLILLWWNGLGEQEWEGAVGGLGFPRKNYSPRGVA